METPDAFQALLRLVGRANLRACCLVSHAWLDEVRALLESGEVHAVLRARARAERASGVR